MDIAFLTALYLVGERTGAHSFGEDALVDLFERVAILAQGLAQGQSAESPKKRAAATLRRLREQDLLARIDGGGVVKTGEYALTRLASGIIEFYAKDETLDRTTLGALLTDLRANIDRALTAARGAMGGSPEDRDDTWSRDVVAPLRTTAMELTYGITRRQRSFDMKQETFQRSLSRLLAADWFGAVAKCQTLLDTTGSALRELHDVLLRDGALALESLQSLANVAHDETPPREDVALTVRGVADAVERSIAWGVSRLRAWSDYHEQVHRFLQDVVRLDPSRMLKQRLLSALQTEGERRYALVVSQALPMRVLREPVTLPDRAPVKRPRKERDKALKDDAQEREDPNVLLEADIRAIIAEGATELSEITARIMANAKEEEHYRLAGRVAQIVSRIVSREHVAERPWVNASEELEVEEWKIQT